jgi:hypothetical protein
VLALHDQTDAASELPSQTPRYRALRRPLEFALRPGIRVMDQRDVGAALAGRERHPQRVEHEIGAHVVRELPADYHPTVGVDHKREEHDALPAAQIREVRDPQAVGTIDREVALNEIRPALRARIRVRGAPRLAAALRALDPRLAHQALHRAASDRLSGPRERLPHPPIPVGKVVALVCRLDQLEQTLVLQGARRALARGSPVIGGRRHVQGPADRLDTEATAMLLDERAHFVRSVSSSLAKNTDADLRISFARRNSKFSLRSFLISSRSAVLNKSLRWPLSASA